MTSDRPEADWRILTALAFAAERHGAVRQPRKGTAFPYLVHPLRVAEILHRHRPDDIELAVAGLLHDTTEDTCTTSSELRERFGDRVADLVEGASEPDKSLDWKPRKQHTIDSIPRAGLDVLHLIAADKLDNTRGLRDDLALHGDRVWERFNAPRHRQAWYYRTLAGAILRRDPEDRLFRTLRDEVEQLFAQP